MSHSGSLVVARYPDGNLVRGVTSDFRPDRDVLTVVAEDGTPTRIILAELKALFFVKSLFGDHSHQEKKTFRHREGVGQRTWVTFADGEKLAGWNVAYEEAKPGFFLFPADPQSNLEKVWVVRAAVAEILMDDAAERAADDHAAQDAGPSVERLNPTAWDEMLGIRPSEYRKAHPSAPKSPPPRRSSRPDSNIFLGDW